ncbi:MAG: heavy-metal-associated domain-containing protein [Candidatus Symbiothrix sp.]|jgi:Cu(I)/Ag(I) efflux system membrane fusion protein|nr:heavy-metal-associated domain-containing protein [Candidatus Symbiothrix sp.]
MKRVIYCFLTAALIFSVACSKEKPSEASLSVQGSCGMCKTRIEAAAKAVSGVVSADWDDQTKVLTVSYAATKTSPDAVAQALAKVGHDAEQYKADDAVYETLPTCCQYRQ